MGDLERVLKETTKLSKCIGEVLSNSEYYEYDDLSGLKIDYDSKEELFLFRELNNILYKTENIKQKIDYLNRPIAYSGKLSKNVSGRYELDNKMEYTCGDIIEALVYDSNYETESWVKTTVEHDGNDYYLVGYKDVTMEGLLVRVRKND